MEVHAYQLAVVEIKELREYRFSRRISIVWGRALIGGRRPTVLVATAAVMTIIGVAFLTMAALPSEFRVYGAMSVSVIGVLLLWSYVRPKAPPLDCTFRKLVVLCGDWGLLSGEWVGYEEADLAWLEQSGRQ